jgi:phosphoglycerate dehydrogenase-like enzyme
MTVRRGQWEQAEEGIELAGRQLGVVGTGRIGARVLEIGRSFGMSSVAWTRRPSTQRALRLGTTFLPLEQVFAESDVVTVHLAHTPETHGLIDARLLERMRTGAIFINTARGGLVDSDALLNRLQAGALGGVGLDVFEPEPPPSGHPLLADERVVWTPHLGFRTQEASRELIRGSIENLLAFAAGELTNVVNQEAIPA